MGAGFKLPPLPEKATGLRLAWMRTQGNRRPALQPGPTTPT